MLSLLTLFDKVGDSSFVLEVDQGGESYFFSLTTPSFRKLPDVTEYEVFLWSFKRGMLELQFDDRVVTLKLCNDPEKESFYRFVEFVSLNSEAKKGFTQGRKLNMFKQVIPLAEFVSEEEVPVISRKSKLVLVVSLIVAACSAYIIWW